MNLIREIATYNCPCVKTGRCRYKPTVDKDCLWLLFIVIAKETTIRNFLLWNLNGILLFDGISFILGMSVLYPMLLPDITYASMTCNIISRLDGVAWFLLNNCFQRNNILTLIAQLTEFSLMSCKNIIFFVIISMVIKNNNRCLLLDFQWWFHIVGILRFI